LDAASQEPGEARVTPRHLAHAHKPARAVHLIDIENLVRGKAGDERLVVAALSAYQTTHPRKVDTLVLGVAARSHRLLNELRQRPRKGRGWAFNFTIVVGHNGPDGADEALLTALELLRRRSPPLIEDYTQVVFASGDGAFVDVAAELQGDGLSVVHVVGMASANRAWRTKVHARRMWVGGRIRDLSRDDEAEAEVVVVDKD
jgi:hypothetical protein